MLPIITENDVDERLEAIDSAAGENAISTDEVHQMTETVLPNTASDELSLKVRLNFAFIFISFRWKIFLKKLFYCAVFRWQRKLI